MKKIFWCCICFALLINACEQPGGTPLPVLDTNANLSLLELNAGNLFPAFSPEITGYTALVRNDVESIVIRAEAAGDKAAVDNPAGT